MQSLVTFYPKVSNTLAQASINTLSGNVLLEALHAPDSPEVSQVRPRDVDEVMRGDPIPDVKINIHDPTHVAC